ncbi:MAG TPA: ABC transporter transmembrane domain-containing protein, partial [Phenylobacterium sp.]|nr:ABC transporter transmembrane domain-containing protein [Phenylobacterium sp.]
MSDAVAAEGRPSHGETFAQGLAEAAERRPRGRNVRALGHLMPFALRHRLDAGAALVFLLTATAATLGISGAVRLLIEHLTAGGATAASTNPWFLLIGAVTLALAASSALRFYFVTKLGERVVADLRQALYARLVTLDAAFYLRLKTGEVVSRLTTDLQIVDTLLTTSVSVALRNLLTLIGALLLLVVVSPRLTG